MIPLLLAACRGDEPAVTPEEALRSAEPPELRLATAAGDTFDLERHRGMVSVVFFGYTRCPDICPLTMQDFVTVKQRLGARADSVRFIFVSVDPVRDTPASTAAWVARFDSSFIGLAGDSAAIEDARSDFHIGAWPEEDRVTHTATVHVLGKDGRWTDILMFDDQRAELLYAAVIRGLR
jgi:protein SCO1/2